MKLNKKLVIHFSLAILCANLTGCGTIPSCEQLGNGYEKAVYTRTSWEPSASRSELRYTKGWKTVVIWRDIRGGTTTNDMAIFVGNKASGKQDLDGRWVGEDQLFAVKAPDLPLDITDEILWRWSKQSGGDFQKILKTYTFVDYENKNGSIESQFAGDGSDINIQLDWNQIADVMREVKEKGVVHKDRVQGTSYIQKEFKPEVQK